MAILLYSVEYYDSLGVVIRLEKQEDLSYRPKLQITIAKSYYRTSLAPETDTYDKLGSENPLSSKSQATFFFDN